jgi:hypothetical protein
MAYIIYNSTGQVILTLADGDVDSSATSLDLIGKNRNNYGEYYNNNLVKLLTSFASTESQQPRSPQTGQLWFNSTTKRLCVYDGASFKPTYGATISATAPLTTSTGDLWYDAINSQLKIWSGTVYKTIAPNTSALFGKFGIEPVDIDDVATGLPVEVSAIYSYGTGVGFVTTATVQLSAGDSDLYLDVPTSSTINQGITVLGNIDIYGDMFIRGERQVAPNRTLSLTLATSDNNEIVVILEKMFPTLSDTQIDQAGYTIGSEARVYSTDDNNVRRFRVEYFGSDPMWEPYNVYSGTNIVS